MDLRFCNLLLIIMIALSACGAEPDPVKMDRRYLAGADLEQEKERLLASVTGEVLDQHEWVLGTQKVFTILSKEREGDTDFSGIFLRQYDLSGQTATLMWTYQDTVSCQRSGYRDGANAGAVLVDDRSPALQPVRISGDHPHQFVLHYNLGCSPNQQGKNLVVVNAQSGTPDVRLFSAGTEVEEA
ncbi:MAG: hypothetical protein AAF597_13930, partial [Bacteroidota bacterium]